MSRQTKHTAYGTRLLTPETWADFAALVEANNGVWGGCWCMGFHAEGLSHESAETNRENKHDLVRRGAVHQVLVYDGDTGVARAAVAGALAAIADAGGGLVEAYPEQAAGRKPQQGAYFHTGPERLYVQFGFERDRRIAERRWVMRRQVRPRPL